MASVTDTPNTLNSMNRGGKWLLTQTPTSPPVETRVAWQVEVDGNLVSEGSESTTSGSDTVPVDPRSDIIGFVKPNLPGLTARSVYNAEDDLIIGVTLKYGTIVIDSTNEPVTKTITIGSSDGPYDFINAHVSPWSGDILNDATDAWLSNHPDLAYTHPWAYSWIYLYGTSGINVSYKTCGGVSGSFTMSAPFVVNAIPTGPKNLNLPVDTKWYKLEFVAMSRTIEFHVQCGFRESECGTIIFLEPAGGLSGHGFTSVSSGGSITSSSVEYHTEPDSDHSDWAQYGGATVIRRSASPTFAMSIQIIPDEKYKQFISGMLASSLAFVQMVDNAGDVVFVKATISSASLTQQGPDGYATLQVAASLSNTLEGQRSVH